MMLELTDSAPLPLRQPVRGLVWVCGRVRVLPTRVARRAALRIAADAPDERLLDVGHADVLLRLDPASVVLSDAEGTGSFTPAEVAAAPADPFTECGDEWLAHLARRPLLAGRGARPPPARGAEAPGEHRSSRSPSTGSACGCAWRPTAATTTCGSGSPPRSRAPACSAPRCGASRASGRRRTGTTPWDGDDAVGAD